MHYRCILFAKTGSFSWNLSITIEEGAKICAFSKNPKDRLNCIQITKNYSLCCRNPPISGVNSHTNTNILFPKHSQTPSGGYSAASILVTADKNPRTPQLKDTKTQSRGQSNAQTPARKALINQFPISNSNTIASPQTRNEKISEAIFHLSNYPENKPQNQIPKNLISPPKDHNPPKRNRRPTVWSKTSSHCRTTCALSEAIRRCTSANSRT